MARTFAGVRLLALMWSLILLSACGGGGGPTSPTGQQLIGTLGIEIRALAADQNSAIIPITLSVPRTNAVDPIPVYLRVGWRRTAVPTDPQRLMTAAPGSLDLNSRNTVVEIPVEGKEITFLWDALADLGPDWNFDEEITVRAGILASNANDPRQAVCDFQPIIRVGFGPGVLGCSTPVPSLENLTTPAAVIGQPYSFQVQAAGGEPPLRYQILDPVSGTPSGSPALGFGLFLNEQTGEISGVPDIGAPSQLSFFARVTDSCGANTPQGRQGTQAVDAGGRFDQARITVPIEGGEPIVCAAPPTITTASLPNAAIDTPYEFQLGATGGEGALGWEVTIDPATADFSVDSNGLITGLPTTPGSYNITAIVSDSCENIQTASTNLVLVVPCGAGPSFNSQGQLPTAAIGTLYDTSFTVSTPNGPGQVTFESGSLPEGIILTPVLDPDNRRITVRLRGTPNVASDAGKNFVFTLRATDTCPSGALSTTQGFTLPVSGTQCTEPLPVIQSPTGNQTLPPGTAGSPYTATLSVAGGTAPVGPIRIVSGAPAGFSMAGNGRTLQGTLPASGPSSYDITFDVSDGCTPARTDVRTLTLDVTPSCPGLDITTTSLPPATNLQPYSTQLDATGGFGSRTWGLSGNSEGLPSGLILDASGLLSGTPDDQARTYNLEFEVLDNCPSGAQSVTRALTLDLSDPACPTPSIDPIDADDPVFQQPYSLQLTGSGGIQPYSFSIVFGSLPSGLSLDNGGLVSGTPDDVKEINVPFTAIVQLTDNCPGLPGTATAELTLTVRPAGCTTLDITTLDLDNPELNVPYSALIEAQGVAPISFAIISGSLPNGLSLSNGGLLSGTANDPKDVGQNFGFTVQATDSCLGGPQTDTQTYNITVTSPIECDPIAILNTGFPDPVVNAPYSQALSADGEPPFTWSLEGGSLPRGLSISPAGLLQGIANDPSEADLEFTFTIGVLDSCALVPQFTTEEFTFVLQPEVTCDDLEITTGPLPDAGWSIPYNFGLSATGEPPLNWSLVDGGLPTGLTLNTAGTISGTPTDASEIGRLFAFEVEVIDSCVLDPQIANKNLAIRLSGPTCDGVSFDPDILPDPVFGAPYEIEFEVSGGVGPYTWSLLPESNLPAGIELTSDGRLSGVATDPEEIDSEFSFGVEIADSCPLGAQTFSRNYNIVLQPEDCGRLLITTAFLPPATNGRPYSFQMTASGGKAPLSWSVEGLPFGLVMTADGLIEGTPDTDPVTYELEFTVSDDCTPTQFDFATIDLTVNDPACPEVTITTEFLENPVVGQEYSALLEAEGGSTPYRWSQVGGSLPTGLFLNEDGTLTGTPDDPSEAGNLFSFTALVEDDCEFGPATATATFEFRLLPAPDCGELTILSSELENPFYQQSYLATLEVEGGIGPYQWTLIEGELPDGLSFDESGTISGLPTNGSQVGNEYVLEVQVTDSCPFNPGSAFGLVSFTLEGPECTEISIDNPPFQNPQLGVFYDIELFGSGEGALTWELVQGPLPSGLSVDPDGFLTGTPDDPEEVGNFFGFTLGVTDECLLGSQSTTRQYSFILEPAPSCSEVSITTEELPDAYWEQPYEAALEATGGVQPYTWQLTDGELPPGLDYDDAGNIFGTMTDPGAIGSTYFFSMEVTDDCPFGSSSDVRQFAIFVEGPTCEPIGISNTGFSNPQLGQQYNQTLFGSGEGALTWELAGGNLPTGISVSPLGALTGTPIDPQQVGSRFDFTLRVSDECQLGSQTTTRDYFVFLNPPLSCGEVTIEESELPDAFFGEDYGPYQLTASGGQPPYSWALTGSGALPEGMTMNAAGRIAGTPTDPLQIGQSFEFEVEVQDSCPFDPGISTAWLYIYVDGPSCATIGINNTGFPNPQLGQPYNQPLFGTGEGNLTWSQIAGNLPTGISVDPDGALVGTPIDPQQVMGSFTFTLQVEDECSLGSQSTTRQFTVRLDPALPCGEITIQDSELPDATIGVPYSYQLTASGGQPPYNWALQDIGVFPDGLTLDASGLISGTPTNPNQIGGMEFLVEVQDSCPFNPGSSEGWLFITLNGSNCGPAPNITMPNDRFPNATVGVPYSVNVIVTGGFGDRTFTLNAGELPPGLSLSPSGLVSGTITDPGLANTEWFPEVKVTDSCPTGPRSDTQRLPLDVDGPVSCPELSFGTFRFSDPYYYDPYGEVLDITGGVQPYSVKLFGGTLPAGLSLDYAASTGQWVLQGTPTNPDQIGDSFTFAIQILDSCLVPQEIVREFQFVLNGPDCEAPEVANKTIQDPVFGQEYAYQFEAINGRPPYTWQLIEGSLPEGLTLKEDGWLVGTPTNPDQRGDLFAFIVRATDVCGTPGTPKLFRFTLQP